MIFLTLPRSLKNGPRNEVVPLSSEHLSLKEAALSNLLSQRLDRLRFHSALLRVPLRHLSCSVSDHR